MALLVLLSFAQPALAQGPAVPGGTTLTGADPEMARQAVASDDGLGTLRGRGGRGGRGGGDGGDGEE